MEETFTYDDMNRLTGVTLKRPSGQDLHCTMTYDSLGRMTLREMVTSENGTLQVTEAFSKPMFHDTKIHAIASAETTEGVFSTTPQTVTYTGFDKVSKVKQGNDSLCYSYGYDRHRILMEEQVGVTSRTKLYVGNCEFVTETDGNTTVEYSHTFLTGPYGVFAVAKRKNGNTELYYVLKDNLGSWTVVTGETGIVKQELGYDAWGNYRDPDTWATYTAADSFDKPVFDRGFTGHEHLYNFGLINMNGRMYDPVVSSFLSADRFVQSPTTAQGFNRYAYCMNNPLRYVDPTGWLAGGGVGTYGEHPLWVPYYVNDMITIDLPEVTILADNPSLSNTYEYEEFEYTPNITSGGFDNGWGRTKGWSSSRHSGGSGGGRGSWGNKKPNHNKTKKILNTQPPLKLIYSSSFVYDGQVWPNPTKSFSIEAGQHVQVEVINANLLGVQLCLQDVTSFYYTTNFLGIQQIVYSGDNHSFVLLPTRSVSFDFYRFDYCPINWAFELETGISEAVNVRINFYSEWKPGMPVDPNHPRFKTP